MDLDNLVTRHFPHTLSGTARIAIQQARFDQGRLQSASGVLVAGPGANRRAVIGRSLIESAVAQLGLQRGAEPKMPDDLVPYEQLALAFSIDSQGLRLQGRSTVGGAAAVLVDRSSRLLSASDPYPRPVVALLRTLVPQSEVQVPATRQTDWLLGYLPIPDVAAPQATGSALPQARLTPGDESRRW